MSLTTADHDFPAIVSGQPEPETTGTGAGSRLPVLVPEWRFDWEGIKRDTSRYAAALGIVALAGSVLVGIGFAFLTLLLAAGFALGAVRSQWEARAEADRETARAAWAEADTQRLIDDLTATWRAMQEADRLAARRQQRRARKAEKRRIKRARRLAIAPESVRGEGASEAVAQVAA